MFFLQATYVPKTITIDEARALSESDTLSCHECRYSFCDFRFICDPAHLFASSETLWVMDDLLFGEHSTVACNHAQLKCCSRVDIFHCQNRNNYIETKTVGITLEPYICFSIMSHTLI